MNYAKLPNDVRSKIQLWVDGVTRWDGDCLLFLLPLKRKGQAVSGTAVGGVNYNIVLRRWTWVAAGKSLSARDCLLSKCGNPACVAPGHAQKVSREELTNRMRRVSSSAKRAQLLHLGAKRRKLSDEQEREVMAWTGTYKAAMEHFGISRGLYFDIRKGKRRAAAGSPMLMMAQELRRAA